ncbi:hypothetical protein BDZ89DRAFT_1065424, partial [Hymenopellis radicata]
MAFIASDFFQNLLTPALVYNQKETMSTNCVQPVRGNAFVQHQCCIGATLFNSSR